MEIDSGPRVIELLRLSSVGSYKQLMPYASMVSNMLQAPEVLDTSQPLQALHGITYLTISTIKKSGFKPDKKLLTVR